MVIDEVFELASFNMGILQNIEPLFLKENMLDREADEALSDTLNNIDRNEFLYSLGVDNYDGFINKINEIQNSKRKSRNKFNALIKALSDFNDTVLDRFNETNEHELFESQIFKNNGISTEKQVFLSYAYEDKLYTIALYVYFRQYNIYLYIDWMHNGKTKDGIWLKQNLHQALVNSEQLIFLRTPNSELKIGGNNYIRPWCSWELGNFYDRVGSKEKFYIDLYSHEESENMQLSGIKVLRSISNAGLS